MAALRTKPASRPTHAVGARVDAIVKGALFDESYTVLAAWDFSLSKTDNLRRVREVNPIGAKTSAWLRHVIRVLDERFDPQGRDRGLAMLARGGCAMEEWKPILLWHITRQELLLRHFLQSWLFDAYASGLHFVASDALKAHLLLLAKRKEFIQRPWTENTVNRVAAGLLKMAVQFGLLQGSRVKEFTSYHLPENSFIYLLHAIQEEKLAPSKVITAADWRMFLMQPSDVESDLLRLHQFRKLDYQVAGSLVQLSLPCSSSREYAERMVA